MLHILLTGLTFLLMLGILVAAHELGHYLFARLFGMGVEEFAVGMGGKPFIYARKRYTIPLLPGQDPDHRGTGMEMEGGGSDSHEPVSVVDGPTGPVLQEATRFTFRVLPIGGFVRIKGMIMDAEGSERTVPGGFYSKPAWQRFIVLLMGPVFSVVTGIVLLFGAMMATGFEVPTTVVGQVASGSAAELAKLQPGDRIVQIENRKINQFADIQLAVRDRVDVPTQVVIQRTGETRVVSVVPQLSPTPQMLFDLKGEATEEKRRIGVLGVVPQGKLVPAKPLEAGVRALTTPILIVGKMAEVFTSVKELKENLGGPVSMVRATNDAVKIGPARVVVLAGLLSISVGFLNLLPIFPLDGGQMMVATIEFFRRGRPISLNAIENLGRAGLAAILLLMVTAFALDIGRLLPKKEPAKSGQATPETSKPR